MRGELLAAASAALLLISCGGSETGASAAVESFALALADSSYREAWELLTPETQARYDSTVSVLRRFGWTESREALEELAGGVPEEEMDTLSGAGLFARMVASAPDAHNLSTSLSSVSYPDSGLGVVVVETTDGLQEILVRRVDGAWLVDLTTLAPPVAGVEEGG